MLRAVETGVINVGHTLACFDNPCDQRCPSCHWPYKNRKKNCVKVEVQRVTQKGNNARYK